MYVSTSNKNKENSTMNINKKFQSVQTWSQNATFGEADGQVALDDDQRPRPDRFLLRLRLDLNHPILCFRTCTSPNDKMSVQKLHCGFSQMQRWSHSDEAVAIRSAFKGLNYTISTAVRTNAVMMRS